LAQQHKTEEMLRRY